MSVEAGRTFGQTKLSTGDRFFIKGDGSADGSADEWYVFTGDFARRDHARLSTHLSRDTKILLPGDKDCPPDPGAGEVSTGNDRELTPIRLAHGRLLGLISTSEPSEWLRSSVGELTHVHLNVSILPGGRVSVDDILLRTFDDVETLSAVREHYKRIVEHLEVEAIDREVSGVNTPTHNITTLEGAILVEHAVAAIIDSLSHVDEATDPCVVATTTIKELQECLERISGLRSVWVRPTSKC